MAQFKQGDRVIVRHDEHQAPGTYLHPMTSPRAASSQQHAVDMGEWTTTVWDDDLIPSPAPMDAPVDLVLSHQLARATDPRVLGWDKMCQIERERTAPAPILVFDPGTVPAYTVADLVALAQPGPIEVRGDTVPHGVQYLEELDVYQVSVQGGKPQRIRAEAARLRVGNPPGHYKRQRVYNAVTAACTPEQCSTVWDTFCEVEARIEARRSADPCTEPSVVYDVVDRHYVLTAPGTPAFVIPSCDVRHLTPAGLAMAIAARGIGHRTSLKLLDLLQDVAREVLA